MDKKTTKCAEEIGKTIVEGINFFRRMHHVDSLVVSKPLTTVANKVVRALLESDDYETDVPDPGADQECVIEHIFDHSLSVEWYVLQWFLKGSIGDQRADILDSITLKFIKMVWKSSKNIGVAVGIKNGVPEFFVVLYSGSNVDQTKIVENVATATLNSKLAVGYLEEQTLNDLVVNCHNTARAAHQVPAIIWSFELEKEAKNVAEKLRETKELKSSDKRSYGINIWFGEGIPSLTHICYEWYSTHKFHKYSTHDVIPESSAYCQMVWKNTTAVGAAIIKEKETYIFVSLYTLPGNAPRKFVENVKKPKKKYLLRLSLIHI